MSEPPTIKGLDIGFGHSYFDIIRNEEVLEFHTDYWNRKQNQELTTTIQPTTSIRMSSTTRPMMIIGQDESAFTQYLLRAKTWVGPSGQRPLLPQSESDGNMMSVFISRVFGFGRVLTEDQSARINYPRCHGSTRYNQQVALHKIAICQLPIHRCKQRRLLEFVLYESSIGRHCQLLASPLPRI